VAHFDFSPLFFYDSTFLLLLSFLAKEKKKGEVRSHVKPKIGTKREK
jgi:hypothetical protein